MLAALACLAALAALIWASRPTRCPRAPDGIHDYRTEHGGKLAICAACGETQDLR